MIIKIDLLIGKGCFTLAHTRHINSTAFSSNSFHDAILSIAPRLSSQKVTLNYRLKLVVKRLH